MNAIRAALLIALSLLLAAQRARAEEAEPTAWACSTCPYPVGWSGDYELGAAGAFGVTPWAGRYTGLDDGVHLIIDADLLRLDADGQRWEFLARDLGLGDRAFSVVERRPGNHRYAFEYRAIPSVAVEGARTPFVGVGSELLTLPLGWVRADTTAGMTQLAGALRPVEVGTERERVAASAGWFERRGFDTDLRATRETKRGTDPLGASLLTRTTLLPEPVDQVTESFEAGLGYKATGWNVATRVRLSTFRNAVGSVTWDVPFTALDPGADRGRNALAPDNDFQQFSVDGAWRGASKLRFNAGLSIGRGSQDAVLLPTSLTPGLDLALPRASAAMDVDTTLAYLRANWTPDRGFALRGEWRIDERDAAAPIQAFPQVVTDTFLAAPRDNIVYDHAKTLVRVEGDWRIGMDRVVVRGQRLVTDRDQGSVARTTEDSVSVEWRGRVFEVLDGAFEVGRDEREASASVPLAGPAPQNPALRYYNTAPLQRDRWAASLSASATDAVSFELRFDGRVEDYSSTAIGLTDRSDHGLGFDVNWTAREDLAFALFYQRQVLGHEQAGSQAFAAADWSALSEDATDAWGLEFDAPYLTEGFGLRAELSLTDATGVVQVRTGATDEFPELRSQLLLLRVDGTWRVAERYAIKLAWRHERFDSSDWAITGVAPGTVPAVLSLGELDPRYEMDVFELAVQITL
jgi:MtrB/PioB family decaheme-associated outer membrane protein